MLEPDCALALDVRGAGDSHRSLLFVRDPDPREELWEGPRTREGAESEDFFGVDECRRVSALPQFLDDFRRDGDGAFRLWYDADSPRSERIHQIWKDFVGGDSSLADRTFSPR